MSVYILYFVCRQNGEHRRYPPAYDNVVGIFTDLRIIFDKVAEEEKICAKNNLTEPIYSDFFQYIQYTLTKHSLNTFVEYDDESNEIVCEGNHEYLCREINNILYRTKILETKLPRDIVRIIMAM